MSWPSFAVGLVVGVILGAILAASAWFLVGQYGPH
jgi:uncharacterized membrane-anchored protein YhcB (DUF1043 family)